MSFTHLYPGSCLKGAPLPSANTPTAQSLQHLLHSVDHCFCRTLPSLSEHYRVLNKHTRCQVSLWRFSLFHLIPHLRISWPLFCLLWLMLTFRQVQEQVLGDSSRADIQEVCLTHTVTQTHKHTHTRKHRLAHLHASNTHAYLHVHSQSCTFTQAHTHSRTLTLTGEPPNTGEYNLAPSGPTSWPCLSLKLT